MQPTAVLQVIEGAAHHEVHIQQQQYLHDTRATLLCAEISQCFLQLAKEKCLQTGTFCGAEHAQHSSAGSDQKFTPKLQLFASAMSL